MEPSFRDPKASISLTMKITVISHCLLYSPDLKVKSSVFGAFSPPFSVSLGLCVASCS